jgi:CarboxypepD_reg-like domain
MKIYLQLLFFVSISTFAQIKGTVKDSLSGQPIPYVNISVENENVGTTSEENGAFKLPISVKDKNLIFSALGFEKKKVKASIASEVLLKPTDYQLDEVVVIRSLGTKQREIGKVESAILQAFDNGPRIDTKYFPYQPTYKKTKYIQKAVIKTDNALEKATFKIHFYSVDEKGFPSEELIRKEFFITVKKGTTTTTIDLTKYQLKMPKNGIFIGVEKLIIDSNKMEKVVTNTNSKTTEIKTTYYPLVLYNRVDRDFLYTFSGGKWNRINKQENLDSSGRMMIYEPAIQLILTN